MRTYFPRRIQIVVQQATRLTAFGMIALVGWYPCASALAQDPDDEQMREGPLPEWMLIPAYPARTTDPAAVERGRKLYSVNGCSFCHGGDTRGGDGGPSLLRSDLVLGDLKGERIGKVIKNGVPDTKMVAFALSDPDIADIAEFLHSFKVTGGDPARNKPPSIVTGHPDAGRSYFDAHCAGCHSASGDLQHVATRFPSARKLQQRWLMPQRGAVTRAVISAGDGAAQSGTLLALDEFIVSIRLDDGTERSFERRGSTPKIELHDPLAAHKALVPTYSDTDIHDITAYLVTLK